MVLSFSAKTLDLNHMWLVRMLSFCVKHVSHPSPVRAQQAWMCHWWSLTAVSCRLCEISATDMQPFTSCLLANTRSPAFLRSYTTYAIINLDTYYNTHACVWCLLLHAPASCRAPLWSPRFFPGQCCRPPRSQTTIQTLALE